MSETVSLGRRIAMRFTRPTERTMHTVRSGDSVRRHRHVRACGRANRSRERSSRVRRRNRHRRSPGRSDPRRTVLTKRLVGPNSDVRTARVIERGVCPATTTSSGRLREIVERCSPRTVRSASSWPGRSVPHRFSSSPLARNPSVAPGSF